MRKLHSVIGMFAFCVALSALGADAPAAPTDFTATAVSATEIDLAWTSPSGTITGYSITVVPMAGFSADASATSYAHSGLTPNTQYTYWIVAFNESGYSESATASATTPDVPPAAPVSLVATSISSSEIDLIWMDPASNESGFEIERFNGSYWSVVGSVGANCVYYADTSMSAGPALAYRVRAYNSCGYSDYSNELCIPNAPADFSAVALSATQISLSWTAVPGMTGYQLFWRGGSCDASVDQNTTSYLITDAGPASWTTISICGVNAAGISAPASATVAVPPNTPSSLMAAAPNSSQVQLYWSDSDTSNISGIEIESSSGGGSWSSCGTASAGTSSYTVYCYPGAYSYRVRALSSYGVYSEYSNVASVTVLMYTSIVALVYGQRVELSWSASINADGYELVRSDYSSSASFSISGNSNTSHIDTGLTPWTSYSYNVRAVADGSYSDWSNVSVYTYWVPPDPPYLWIANSTWNEVDLAWTDTYPDELGFHFARRDSNWNYCYWDVGPNVTAYADTTVQPETNYVYTVSVFNQWGASNNSNEAWTNTGTPPIPAAPSNLQAVAVSQTQIDLSWTDNSSNEQGFLIQHYDGCSWVYQDSVSPNVASLSITGLQPGTSYSFRVTAFTYLGYTSGFSNDAAATTVPEAPYSLWTWVDTEPTTRINVACWFANVMQNTNVVFERSSDGITFSYLSSVPMQGNTVVWPDCGLSPLSTWYYRAKAVSSGGESAYSNTASSTTAGPPSAPTNLTATAVSSYGANLTWTPGSGEVSGCVLCSRADPNSLFTRLDISPGNSWFFEAASGASYECVLMPWNQYGQSYSETIYVTLSPLVANVQYVTVLENTSITFALDAGTSYSAPLNYTLLISPNNGSLSAFGGNVTYTPNTWYHGMDSFTYRVDDGDSVLSCASATVYITVNQAAPVANPDFYGTVSGQTLAASSVLANDTMAAGYTLTAALVAGSGPSHGVLNSFNQDGTFSYTADSNFYGTDSFSYVANDGQAESNSATVTINIKGVPVVTWVNPASIAYGAALSSAQLNATTDVPGTFVYTPATGSILDVGNSQNLSASFTPTDAVSYTTATATVSIDVTQATPEITWNNPAAMIYGAALDDSQLNASANVPGRFAYSPDAGTSLGAGNGQTLAATFTPADATNYTTATATVSIDVAQAVPEITWSNPADIAYGTELGAAQLNASANVDGTFAYTPAAGTVLNVGNGQTLLALFTPNDPVNYSTASATVNINVLGGDVPLAPTNLCASVGSQDGCVVFNLSWMDASNNESGFEIQSSSDGTSWNYAGSVGAKSSSAVMYVYPGAEFTYRVRAYNESGNSGFSNQVLIGAAPDAPSGFWATATSTTEISLSWSAPFGSITGYQVTCSASGSSGTFSVGSGATSYIHSGLSPFTEYTYLIVAANAWGQSSAATSSATTPDVPPAAPSGLCAYVVSSYEVDMYWADNSNNGSQFIIERSIDGVNFNYCGSSQMYNWPPFQDSCVSSGNQYYYRVKASNSAGDSDYSNVSMVTILSAPSIVAVLNGSRVDLSWSASAYATGYQIVRNDYSSSASFFVSGGSNTTFNDTALKPWTNYTYSIQAVGDSGSSGWSSVYITTGSVPPDLWITFTSWCEVDLAWTDPYDDEYGFVIHRTDWQNYATQTINTGSADFTTGPNVTAFGDTTVVAETNYVYTVSASGPWGSSGDSNSAATTTGTPPGMTAPTNFQAVAVSPNQIDLSWMDNSSSELGFYIQQYVWNRYTYAWEWAGIASVGSNVTVFNVTGLEEATGYSFRVAAYTNGYSSVSEAASAATPAYPVPAPTNLIAQTSISPSNIDLNWMDTSDNETGFVIEISTDGNNFTLCNTVGPNTTYFGASMLSSSTQYWFRVKAVRMGASDSDYSNVASATTLGPPAAPSNLTATAASSTAIHLSWTDNSGGAASFKLYEGLAPNLLYEVTQIQAGTTSCTRYSLTVNSTYYYQVTTFNIVGDSPFSNTASATPSLLANDLDVTVQEDSSITFTLDGSGVPGASLSYALYSSPSLGTASISGQQVTYTPWFGNYGADSFTYAVTDNMGWSPSASATVYITVEEIPPPAAPSSLVATVISPSRIQLSWLDNSNCETGFTVERRTDGNLFGYYGWVGSGATQFQDTSVTPSIAYYYRVKANGAHSDSAFSNEAQAIAYLPVAQPQTVVTNEDTSIPLTLTSSGTGNFIFMITSPPTSGSLVGISPNLTYVPGYDWHGEDTFTFAVTDGMVHYSEATVCITVHSVNDAPTMAGISDLSLADNAGVQTVDLQGIYPGATDESMQFVTVTAVSSNHAVLADPTVVYMWPNTTGYLSFTPLSPGSTQITVTVQDDGGTANGGVDSITRTFNVTVYRVNQPPSFTAGGDQAVFEDAGPQTVAGWATNISAGPPREAAQTLTFHVTNNNAALFLVQPDVSVDGRLTYTPAPNANGSASVTVWLQDNGGTENSGMDRSCEQTFTITVTHVNAPPTANDQVVTVTENSPRTFVLDANDPENEPLTFDFSSPALTQPTKGTVTGTGPSVTYTPGQYFVGDDSFTYSVTDGSSAVIATVTLRVYQRPQYGLSAMAGWGSVTLSWNPYGAMGVYYVLERRRGAADYIPVNSGIMDTTYADRNLESGATYTYRVRAVVSGQSLDCSEEVTATIPTLPCPAMFTATGISSTRMQLGWVANTGIETAFSIERRTDGSAFVCVAAVGATSSSYVDVGLSPSTHYIYRICTITNFGNSDPVQADGSTLDLPQVGFALAQSSGLESTASVSIQVQLNAATVEWVSVDCAVNAGWASAYEDYDFTGGTLTFSPGETTKTLSLSVIDDDLREGDETIVVSLSNPRGAVLGAIASHTYTIIDDEPLPTINFEAATSSSPERVEFPSILVRLSVPCANPVSVGCAVSGGSAVPRTNFVLESETVTFTRGQTTVAVPLHIWMDGVHSQDKTIELTLSSPVGAGLGTTTVHTLTICEPAPYAEFETASSSGPENAGSAGVAVVLSEAATAAVEVRYDVSGGTARDGADFESAAGTLIFSPGETRKRVYLSILDNSVSDGDRTVVLTLTSTGSMELGPQCTHVFTITDDEPVPSVEFESASLWISKSVPNATVPLLLGGVSGQEIGVVYSITGGTAVNGVDYVLVPGSVVLASAATEPGIALQVVTDTPGDSPKTIELTLSSATQAVLGTQTVCTVTIVAPPVPGSQEITLQEDDSAGVTLTAADPGGFPVTFELVDYPTKASLSGVLPDLVYTPRPAISGLDSFTFTASNGTATSAPATVKLHVAHVNHTPVANNDCYNIAAYSLSQESSFDTAHGVLANDEDIDGDVLTAQLVTEAQHGTVQLQSDGSFTFTPVEGYLGPDQFTYAVSDSQVLSPPATVTLYVTNQVEPVISSVQPPDGSWTNQARPQISGDLSGAALNLNSLLLRVCRQVGTRRFPVMGGTPTVSSNHFMLDTPSDLVEGEYEVTASIDNANAVNATLTWHFSVDLTPPEVSDLPAMFETPERRPIIGATYSDALSGVQSAVFTLDGNTVLETSEADLTWQPDEDLVYGTHEISLTVTDNAGNSTISLGYVRVLDPGQLIGPPVFGAASLGAGSYVSCNLTTATVLHVPYSNADASSVRLSMNGVEIALPEGAATESALTYTLPAELEDGRYSWTIRAYDSTGVISGTAASYFYVDSTAPVLLSMLPKDGLIGDEPLTTIHIAVSDEGSGVNWETAALSVIVNGNELGLGTPKNLGSTVTLDPPSPIYGECQVAFTVADDAGNMLNVNATRTPALSALGSADDLNAQTWTALATRDVRLPYQEQRVYYFRVAFAEGADPDQFTVAGAAELGLVRSARGDEDGYIYFETVPLTEPVRYSPVVLTIAGSDGQTYDFHASFGIFDDSAVPQISIWHPAPDANGNAAGTYGPFTEVCFTASDDWEVCAVELSVNGEAQQATLSALRSSSVTGSYRPSPSSPYVKGSNTVSITAHDPSGKTTTRTVIFNVDDTSAPAISLTPIGPFINSRAPVIRFSVSDGDGFGVDPNATSISYAIDGVPHQTMLTADRDTLGVLYYSVPLALADGSVVAFTINAADRDPTSVHSSTLSSGFTVDLSGPVISNILPPAGTLELDTAAIAFDVADTGSGVQAVHADLLDNASGICVAVLVVQSGGTLLLDIPAEALEAGRSYRLDIEATDQAGNTTRASTRYLAGGDTSGPSISIDASTATTTPSLSARIVVTDTGSGVNSQKLYVWLDGTGRNAANVTVNDTGTVLTADVQLSGIYNGAHQLSVEAYDGAGNWTIEDSYFTLARPLPPQPAASAVATGTQYITIIGFVPTDPKNLVDLEVSVTGAQVVSAELDRTTMQWKVVLSKTDADQVSYSISFKDVDGFVSGTALSGSATFAAGPNQPPVAQPLPAAAAVLIASPGIQGGTTTPDTEDTLTLYWDFAPEDITGVSRPSITGSFWGFFRGWVPGNNTGQVRVRGTVVGSSPPFLVRIWDKNQYLERQTKRISKRNFEFVLPDMSERFYEDISVSATDARGRTAVFHPRSLYVDMQPLGAEPGGDLELDVRSAVIARSGASNPVFASMQSVPGLFEEFPDDYDPENTFWPRGSGLTKVEFWQGSGAPVPGQTIITSIYPRDIDLVPAERRLSDSGCVNNGGVYDGWGAIMPLPEIPATGDETPLPSYSTPFSMNLTDGAGNATPLQGTVTLRGADMPLFLPVKSRFFVQEADGIHALYYEEPGVYVHRMKGGDPSKPGNVDRKIRVYDPTFKVDEDGDGTTDNEDSERQLAHGAITHTNDALCPTLQLVTFDTELQNPEAVGAPREYCWGSKWNGAIPIVTLWWSRNVRLWRTPEMRPEDLLQTVADDGSVLPYKTWNFADQNKQPGEDEDEGTKARKDFAKLAGRVYLECLPEPATSPRLYGSNSTWLDPGMHYCDERGNLRLNQDGTSIPPFYPRTDSRFIELSCQMYTARIRLWAVDDKNEGIKEGEPSVGIAGPAAAQLSSGALTAAWPVARSASRIIPDIYVYYNSRDHFALELDERFPRGLLERPFVAVPLGEMPPHMRHNLEMRVIRGDHTIVLVEGDGTRVFFHPDGDLPPGNMGDEAYAADTESEIVWRPEARKGHFSELTTVTRAVFGAPRKYYVLKQAGKGLQYVFEQATGKLSEIRDGKDNWARLEYEEYGGTRGRLKAVVDNRGLCVRFDSSIDPDGNMKLIVTDVAGRKTTVDKDGVDGPMGRHVYGLDDKQRINRFTDVRGNQYLVTSDDKGIVNSVFSAIDSRRMSFAYNFSGGSATVNHFSGMGEPSREDAYSYDAELNVWRALRFGDGAGNFYNLSQQASKFGQVASQTDLLGGNWPLEYDSETGLQKGVTDPDGHKFSAIPDPIKNPRYSEIGPNYLQNYAVYTKQIDGNNKEVNYSHSNGFLAGIADTFGNGRVTQWDDYGLPTRIVGPRSGYAKAIKYDDLGRPERITETGGNTLSISRYTTDAYGQVREITLSDKRVIRRHFDMAGRLLLTEGPLVTDAEKQQGIADGGATATLYEPGGQWVAQLDANGGVVSRRIDVMGRVTSFTDKSGATTYYREFNNLGLPRYTDLPAISQQGCIRTTEHTYDLLGREIRRVLPTDDIAKPRVETIQYLSGGRTIEHTDPRGIVTRYLRLASGRLKRVEIPSAGTSTDFSYDGNGSHSTTAVLGLASNTTDYAQYGLPRQSGVPELNLMTKYERDPAGDVSHVTLPGPIDVHAPKDARGRVQRVSVGGNGVAEYLFEDAARATVPTGARDLETAAQAAFSRVDAYWRTLRSEVTIKSPSFFGPYPVDEFHTDTLPQEQTLHTGVTYRNTGEVLSATDGNGHVSTNTYDAAGHLTAAQDQDGLGPQTEYYQSGAIARTIDDRGKATEYIYAAVTGFLKALRFPDGKGVSFERDEDGNIVAATYAMRLDAIGDPLPPGDGQPEAVRYTYKYDDRNRLVEKSDPGQHRTKYEYYTSGLLASVTDPDNRTNYYYYDGAGRLKQTTCMPGPQVTFYKYDANGQIGEITYPDLRVTKFKYDSRGRLAEKTSKGEGTTQYSYNAGNLNGICDALGNWTWFVYDSAHRLVETQYPGLQSGVCPKKAYDAAGFLIGASDEKGQVFQYENHSNGRRRQLYLVNPTPATGQPCRTALASFAYDGNTAVSDGNLSWSLDDAGRVTSVSGGAGAGVTYAYNHPLGHVTRKSYLGTTLDYAYDSSAYLASVTDGTNSLTYTQRTAAGLPVAAEYSNGIDVNWQYQFGR
ncbi:MAG TPA: tandem-95 repeat protein, partial [Planctomycetota bacterium]